MALYSRRMQIEQNFRDDKSPRFGFGLRLSRSRGRLEVLNMVAAMASLVMWLAGYRAERQCLQGTIRQAASGINGFCPT